MNKKFSLIKHPLGFYEIYPKPSISELNEHYVKKYYQKKSGSYQDSYSEEELKYFKVCGQIALKTIYKYSTPKTLNLLDLGCGEGFFSSFFDEKGWDTSLVDFSDVGLKRHNSNLLKNFTQSEILTYVENKKEYFEKFSVINLDNVLEHVINPISFLSNLKSNISSDAILRIEVPNDFSSFQDLLTNLNYTEKTWITPPEHLNYFNASSLKSLLANQGFVLLSLQVDFPIEQFLINKHSNYWKNRDLGKEAHLTRVTVTNYLAEKNLDRMIDYQEAAADLEFGRLLAAYVKVAI
jgi:2-polyprenyl-3-methyl-5-hydroxy-6-metoxy-1,4-benzoquinol methylase